MDTLNDFAPHPKTEGDATTDAELRGRIAEALNVTRMLDDEDDLTATLDAVLAAITDLAWIVPKRGHERASVGPRILADGWIRREAGESAPAHTRTYAAQLLAAADAVEAVAKDAA